jgi:hypothetical protein
MTTDFDDPGFTALADTWRSAELPLPPLAPIPRALRERVQRGSRQLVLGTAIEIVVTVAVLALAATILAASPPERPDTRWIWWTLAIAHSGIVWAFTLWNRRGIWRPLAQDTAAFLALTRERARRRRHAALFILWFVAAEACAAVVANAMAPSGLFARRVAQVPFFVLLAICVVATAIAATRMLRTARRELAWAERLSID